MADWLIQRNSLIGKTRAEVVLLLGTPLPTEYPEYLKQWDMVYRLGAARGFIVLGNEWLVLRLGASGVVAEVELLRDIW